MAYKSKSPEATGIRGMRLKGPDRYELRVYLGEDEDGNKRILSEMFHGQKKDAETRLAQLKQEKRRGLISNLPKENMSEFLDRWLRDYVDAGFVRPDTQVWYRMQVKRNIAPYIGMLLVKKLTPVSIQRLYADLRKAGKSDNLRAGAHRTLRAALNWGERQGTVSNNPIGKVPSPKAERPNHAVLTVDEVKTLLSVIKERHERYYNIILLALMTGIREGEILGLRWQDIDLESKTIHISQQLKEEGNKPVFSDVKTRAGRRVICISDREIAALKDEAQKQTAAYHAAVAFTDFGLVFSLPNGNPVPRKNLTRSLKLALIEAGITKPFTFHGLRRTSATLIYLQDPNIRMIQERLGHSEVRTTLSYYTGVVPGHQKEAAANLANLLFGKDTV